MKKNYIWKIVLGILVVFFLLFGVFYDKTNKHNGTNNSVYNRKVMDIKDTSNETEACADAIETFYQDENYKYSFPCMKSSKVIVFYNDGTQDYVRNALSNKDITISDLDFYNIKYIREDLEFHSNK